MTNYLINYRRTRIPGPIPGRAPATFFSATSLSGCMIWLKANELTLNDNDPVSSWTDYSGNSNHATEAGATRPIFKTNIINSKPAVFFADTDYVGMVTPIARANGTNWSIFIVYNMPSVLGGAHRVIQGSNNFLIGPYNDYHQLYNGGFIQGPALSTSWVYTTVTMVGSSGLTDYRVSGTSIGTRNGDGPGTIYLGGEGVYFDEPAGCNVAEMIVYSETRNSTEITLVENYLKSKYGL